MNTRPRPQIGPHWPPAYEIFIPSAHHLTRDGANSFIAAVNIVAKRLEKGGPGRAARLPSRRRSAARVKCANGCRWRLLGVQLVRHKLLIFLPVIPFFPQVGGGVSPIKQGRWWRLVGAGADAPRLPLPHLLLLRLLPPCQLGRWKPLRHFTAKPTGLAKLQSNLVTQTRTSQVRQEPVTTFLRTLTPKEKRYLAIFLRWNSKPVDRKKSKGANRAEKTRLW